MKETMSNLLKKINPLIFLYVTLIIFHIIFLFLTKYGFTPRNIIIDSLFYLLIFYPLTFIKNKTVRYSVALGIFSFIIGILVADYLYFSYFGYFASVRDILMITEITGENKDLYVMPLIQKIFIVLLFVILGLLIFIFPVKKFYKNDEFENKIRSIKILIPILLIGTIMPLNSKLTRLDDISAEDPEYYLSKVYVFDTMNQPNGFVEEFSYTKYRTRDFFTTIFGTKDLVNIDDVDAYFENKPEKTSNMYTEAYKDYNVVMVAMETMDVRAIDEDLTPNLYWLLNNSIIINDYFVPTIETGNTCNTEFMTLTSLYPVPGEKWDNGNCHAVSSNYFPYALPNQLKNNGYETYYLHNGNPYTYERRLLMPSLGFDKTIFDLHSDDRDMLPSLDKVDYSEKFYLQILTYSGHTGNHLSRNKDFEEVDNRVGLTGNYTIDHQHSKYIATDDFIGGLMDKMIDEGVYENTIFVFYPDHNIGGISREKQLEYFGVDYTSTNEIHRQQLIIHVGGSTPTIAEYNITSQSLDIAPTILNMVVGLDAEYGYFMGNDIFDGGSNPVFSNGEIYYEDDFYGPNYEYTGIYDQQEVINAYADIQRERELAKQIAYTNYFWIIK